MCCLRGTHCRSERYTQTESKGVETLFHENENKKQKAGAAILILDKIDLKTNAR